MQSWGSPLVDWQELWILHAGMVQSVTWMSIVEAEENREQLNLRASFSACWVINLHVSIFAKSLAWCNGHRWPAPHSVGEYRERSAYWGELRLRLLNLQSHCIWQSKAGAKIRRNRNLSNWYLLPVHNTTTYNDRFHHQATRPSASHVHWRYLSGVWCREAGVGLWMDWSRIWKNWSTKPGRRWLHRQF